MKQTLDNEGSLVFPGYDEDGEGSVVMEEEEEQEVLAEKETTRVWASKIFVYLFICVAAGGAGWWTFLHMESENQVWYFDEFEEFSEMVFDTSRNKMQTTELAITSLCDTFTAFALDRSELSWPFVTLPNFGVRAEKTRGLAGIEVLAYVPIVHNDTEGWLEYASSRQDWLSQDMADLGLNRSLENGSFFGTDFVEVQDIQFPIWQLSPLPLDPLESPLLTNLAGIQEVKTIIDQVIETRQSMLSPVINLQSLVDYKKISYFEHEENEDEDEAVDDHDKLVPRSLLVEPIFESFQKDASIVGIVVGVMSWADYFDHILEDEAEGLIINLENSCDNSVHSFRITSAGSALSGYVDEDRRYSDATERERFGEEGEDDDDDEEDEERRHRILFKEISDTCGFYLKVHMSHSFTDNWQNNRTTTYPAAVVLIFVLTGLIFLGYDITVQRRQNKVMKDAKKTQRIVSSLFPKDVRDRMMAEEDARESSKNSKFNFRDASTRDGLVHESIGAKPTSAIADLFPKTTVIFADMVGFTSWSSAREPQDVFALLESVYGAFDKIAKRRGVFKVETIGDCYVAVCGLPEPNEQHAIVMARFAFDCLDAMKVVVKQLETNLGPDTGDLTLRIGLHSGPVTAGVLRGEKSRFQLFGDTVNTAARMESNGAPNRIHVSDATAKLIIESGKEHWLAKRSDEVVAKGKGVLRTYWVNISDGSVPSRTTAHTDPETESDGEDKMEPVECFVDDLSADENVLTNSKVEREGEDTSAPIQGQFSDAKDKQEKVDRLIRWSAEALAKILVRIIQARSASSSHPERRETPVSSAAISKTRATPLGEQVDSIELPNHVAFNQGHGLKLDSVVSMQLKSFVTAVASRYHDHPFHNFEHACHVTMSAVRLLGRTGKIKSAGLFEAKLEDPLTQFAFVFSALIHDIDHGGVSNCQLAKEQTVEATTYGNRCIAEQNSIDVAWKLLMEGDYNDLRHAIYSTPQEFEQFRQIVVNCVLATDIFDKDQICFRAQRWEDVFAEGRGAEYDQDKATTIFLEHLIQASDVSHTMQHWQVYRKWNEMLFMEFYKAYSEGRYDQDPSLLWYEGEIGFFDTYIIPLAEKFAEGGELEFVGDQMLSYACQNKEEWMEKGKHIVATMTEQAKRAYERSPPESTGPFEL